MNEQVIWERTIDHERIEHRKQRFLKLFIGPGVAILVVVLIVAGVGNAIGVAIVLGLVGLAWGNTVRYQALSDRANPTMTYDGVLLRVGPREVIVADIKRYTTLATSVQTSILGSRSRIHIGKAVFRLDNPGTRRDPQLVEFGWPNLDEAGIESITAALEPILEGRWVEPVELLMRMSSAADIAATASSWCPRWRAPRLSGHHVVSSTTPSLTAGAPDSLSTSKGTISPSA